MSELIGKQKVARRRPDSLSGAALRRRSDSRSGAPARGPRRFVPRELAPAASRPARAPVSSGSWLKSLLKLQKPLRQTRSRGPRALLENRPLGRRAATGGPARGTGAPRPARRPQSAGRTHRTVARAARGGLARGLNRLELILAAALLAAALAPLAFRVSFPDSHAHGILLPEAADAETALFEYLVPEEFQGAGGAELHPEAVDRVQTRLYTVRSGDTISGIAQRFGLNMDTVISYNDIDDARGLREGATLTLPNADGLKYRVRRGDYLEGIARQHGVALSALLDWNSLESALIVPGQELFVPGARLSEMERNRVFGRLFIYPAAGRITSRFGIRSDPITGLRRFHNGVDLANAVGTPVQASMSGRVAMLGYNPNFGKYIILSHPEGFQTLYGHLDAFMVQKGERVSQGQTIARMGNTGYSTGSHLHFSVFKRGEPVDPFKYLH